MPVSVMAPPKLRRSTICCAEAGVGKGLCPSGEGFVGCDRDGDILFAFCQYLEEEFGAAPVEFHVAEFVDHEEVDAP